MQLITTIQNRLQRRPTEGKYIAEVDGLRFIAIFAVVLQHLSERMIRFSATPFDIPIVDNDFAFFISRGTVGVFLFFAISGFVLSLPFAHQSMLRAHNLPPLSIKRFYLRRLERIEPPFLIWMSFFTLVLIVKGAYSASQIFPHWLASVTYTHFLFFQSYSIINPVAWSLEIEIQFYLLAPFLAMGYFNIKNKGVRRSLLITFCIIFILLQGQIGWLHHPLKSTLLGRLPNFLIGFFITDLYLNEWKNGFKKQLFWDFIAIVSFITMCYTWTEETLKTLVFNFSLALLFVSAFKGYFFNTLLSKPWIAIIGGMCYTIYLTHLPLLEGFMRLTAPLSISGSYALNLLIQSMLILPIILISTIVFFIFTEKPFMKKNWYRDIKNTFLSPAKTFKRLVIPVFLLTSTTIVAQDADSLNVKNIKLRPLEELIELAIQNSPNIKTNQIDQLRQTLAIKIQKNSWTDYISLGGGTLYGTGAAIDGNNTGTVPTYVFSNNRSVSFNVNLGFRLSASDFVTRKTKNEVQRLALERIQQERLATEQSIREVVGGLYTQLELSIKTLRIKAELLENQRIGLVIAEKFYKAGNYKPAEYSEYLNKVAAAEEQYESAKAEIKKYILSLKNLVGGSIF